MTKKNIDAIDKQLICKLSENGRLPAGKISEHLNITSPTVRSRLKALTDTAVLKIAGLVNAYKIRGLTTAFVGIQLETYRLDTKLEEISALDQVVWACVVTGQYDIIVEVISLEGMVGLHNFLAEKLYKVGGIKSSETFVVMKSKHKWILLPKGIRDKLESINMTIGAQ